MGTWVAFTDIFAPLLERGRFFDNDRYIYFALIWAIEIAIFAWWLLPLSDASAYSNTCRLALVFEHLFLYFPV
jgi:hypothetical protein